MLQRVIRYSAFALLIATAAHAQGSQWRSFGPFKGYMSSVPRQAVPLGFVTDTSSYNWNYDPVEQKLVKRSGIVSVSDSLAALTGSTRALQVLQMASSPSQSGGSPQTTYQPVATVLSDATGALGALSIAHSGGYRLLGKDGAEEWDYRGNIAANDGQNYIVTPMTNAGRALGFPYSLLNGARRAIESGNWMYFPNALGTPMMWSREWAEAGAAEKRNRMRPWGQYTPMYVPDVPASSYPTPTTNNNGAWKEGEKFWISVVFRFDDGSYSMPVIPDLSKPGCWGGDSGLVQVPLVDPTGTDHFFRYVPWRNIPVGPYGTVARILLRSTKVQNGTGGVPAFRDLRVTAIIENNTQTSYDDPNGDDNSLVVSDDVVRFDLMWPKSARYAFANDSRVVIAGAVRPNPAVMLLAPTGRTTTRDRNNTSGGVGYTDITAYGDSVFFGYKVTTTDSLVCYLHLATTTEQQFYLGGGKTIRTLINEINATTTSSAAGEWAAQLVPGADDAMLANRLDGTGTTNTGDAGRMDNGVTTGRVGVYWVRGTSWPGVLYDATTQSDADYDNQSIYFTGANPGTPQSNALNFYVGNRRMPPNRNVGRCLGGAPVRDRFIICYENAVYVLRNVRGGGTGEDQDYRLVPLNESRGVVSWSSIVAGDGFVGYMTRDGFVVTDSEREVLISAAVWDGDKGLGDWSTEIPKSARAMASDGTDSYLHAAVIGSQIHITYRSQSGHTYADRRLVYDYSGSTASSGLDAVLDNGRPFGWSTPLITYGVGPMAEVMYDGSGPYRFGASEIDANGALYKFDTGTTDLGANITAQTYTGTDLAESYQLKAAEQVVALHKKNGSGLTLSFYRDKGRAEASTINLSSSGSSIYGRTVADIPLTGRAPTEVFEFKIADTSTGNSELWTLGLKYRVLDSSR